jgi:hypothetical protein
MAAKNKRLNRAGPSPTERQPMGLHFRASQHREELLDEARELLAAGRIREARAVEKRAGQLEQLLGALEAEVSATRH